MRTSSSRALCGLVVFAACGGGGGGGTPPDAPPGTGSLTVAINAPDGGDPTITVTGPGGFSQTLGATVTLTDLVPGDYTVAADPMRLSGTIVSSIDTATLSGSPATVEVGNTADVIVTYARRPGSGQLWVADSSISTMSALDANVLGVTATVTPAVGLGFDSSSSVSSPRFDHDGNLWVMASGTNQVFRLEPAKLAASGTAEIAATLTLPSYPQMLSFAQNGDLWVGTLSPAMLLKYNAADLAGTGALTANPAVEINVSLANATLTATAMDASGNLWVSLHTTTGTIYEYAAAQLATTGTPTPTKTVTSVDLARPSALAFDGSGNLWAADFAGSATPNNILRFDAATLASSDTITDSDLTITSTVFNSPNCLAFDEAGNLWFCNNGSPPTVDRLAASQLVGSFTKTVDADVVLTPGVDGLGGIAFDAAPAGLPL